MTRAILVVLALATAQDPKTNPKPEHEDEVVAGLPDGDTPPLPNRVQWAWNRALAAKTSRREHYDLSGFWRFAAVDEQQPAVKRSEMGWIEMPAFPSAEAANVFDRRFRESDGLWRGKPLDKFPFLWIERDVRLTNDDALEWLNRRVFLVVRGPWSESEFYTSQRINTRKEAGNDPANDVHVHVEQVTGIERAGSRWFDITEQLIYPGTTQISMRYKRQAATNGTAQDSSLSPPYIGLERWPTGPRIDSIELRRNADSSALQLTLFLERPEAFMIRGLPPVRTIPLSLEVRLETGDPPKVIAKRTEQIGPLAELKRSITLTIPWSTAENAARQVRLHTRLDMNIEGTSGILDEPFPIEFQPDQLDVADQKGQ